MATMRSGFEPRTILGGDFRFEPTAIFGGDFRIGRLLGEGGMGAVYQATQLSTSTERALKLMQRDLVQDPRMRERFAQEARLGAQLESDHVVQVVAAGVDADTGIPWIAMELLRGLPLDRYLTRRGRLPPGEARFLLEQLCHALGAAHEQEVVHRDLKPSNVFLSTSRVVGLAYVVKVLDFGIAKVLAEAKTTRTAALGTPLYMAPEQYRAGKVTPASDVWALGLIAFELLTGCCYWKTARGNDATPATVMFETCMGELCPPSERAAELGLDASLPEGFDGWFARAVCREPALRFATAREAWAALAPLLGPAQAPLEGLPSETALVPRAGCTALAVPAAMVGACAADHDGTEPGHTVAAGLTTTAQPIVVDDDRGLTVLAAALPARAAVAALAPGAGAARRRVPRLVAVLGAGLLAAAVAVLLAMGHARSDSSVAAVVSGAWMPPAGDGARSVATPSAPTTQFQAVGELSVLGRVAHRQIPSGERVETYVMLELEGTAEVPATRAPVHLALVIDRSGSMTGARLRQAKAAATTALDRLHDGDMVSVTAFDTEVLPLVPPTVLSSTSRPEVAAAIDRLSAGSDTCISCGLAAAMKALASVPDLTGRVLLLSDGEANVQIRDVAGFARIGREAQARDVSVSTIGVGIDYNERILTALARESNGRHYYADTDASLPRIFDAETSALGQVVATKAVARIELAPGVELVELLDRAHDVEGSTVIVPLGQFSRGEQKTVLAKLSLAGHTSGSVPICKVDVELQAARGGGRSHLGGELSAQARLGAEANDLDPAVEARVQRSETSRSLVRANELFAGGKPSEADQELAAQSGRLERQRTLWTTRKLVPAPVLLTDLDAQSRALADARAEYRSAAASRPAAVAARSAPAKANARMRAMQAYDFSL